MSIPGGVTPLLLRRLAAGELHTVARLEFAAEQVERFLGPLHEIIETVRSGSDHQMVGIEEGGELVGFVALHPDRRDRACWWLGWFGIDRRRQGGGRGTHALAAVMTRLCRLPSCREVRLLVAPDNAAAIRLYRRAGFLARGMLRRTGELVMRRSLPPRRPSAEAPARVWANPILIEVIAARICRMGVPVAAQLHGEVAFPP